MFHPILASSLSTVTLKMIQSYSWDLQTQGGRPRKQKNKKGGGGGGDNCDLSWHTSRADSVPRTVLDILHAFCLVGGTRCLIMEVLSLCLF